MKALLIPAQSQPTQIEVNVEDGTAPMDEIKPLIFGEADGVIGFGTFGRRFGVYLDDLGALTDTPVNETASRLLDYPVIYGTVVLFGLDREEGDLLDVRAETVARALELWTVIA